MATDIHPCMTDRKIRRARIHLPVAPLCNTFCLYCERNFLSSDKNQIYPGFTSEVLIPEEALLKTIEFIDECEDGIVGIAGPGEPLANPETIETFYLIRSFYPDITLCLCTNGLNLPEYVHILKELDVRYLTVTINGLLPSIVEKIQPWVKKNEQIITGKEGASLLIESQISGIEKAIDYGLSVKVNSVVIPSVNDHHIETIAGKVSLLGVSIFNPIPVIPRGKFKNLEKPSELHINNIYKKCSPYMSLFTKCRQCRADAVYKPGKGKCYE